MMSTGGAGRLPAFCTPIAILSAAWLVQSQAAGTSRQLQVSPSVCPNGTTAAYADEVAAMHRAVVEAKAACVAEHHALCESARYRNRTSLAGKLKLSDGTPLSVSELTP